MANQPIRLTLEEKSALVTEIDRRYRAGEGALREIASQLGTSDSNYYNWVRAGIRPVVPAQPEKPAPTRRYDQAERERLTGEIERLRETGLSIEGACRKVGIAKTTYQAWREADAPPPAMVPVEVKALVPIPTSHPETTSLALVAPSGYRIEGLSVATAAELLRALAC